MASSVRMSDVMGAIERIAPLSLASEWDNVGLLVGSPDRTINGPVYLTIDLTERVLDEIIQARAAAVIAYHPPIFHAVKRLTSATARERVVLRAIEAGLPIYSPHSALDAMAGGMTDWLCEGVSGSTEPGKIAGDHRALSPNGDAPARVKIVTFVPERSMEQVRHALASAGAGRIGAYSVCSFAVRGTGTFFGEDASAPVIGEKGRLESVEEHRLEMVCPRSALPIALETLREFHPYEEPAIDVYDLLPLPNRRVGSGRRVTLDQAVPLVTLAERIKAFLGVSMVKVADAHDDPQRLVQRVGVCPGAGAELAPAALTDACDVFFTGEMRYHEVMDAISAGMSIILAGHSNTERGFLPRLAARLNGSLRGVEFRVSRVDRSPLTTY
jgi:dinuclear metal center YbgI/SA1388 family protein